MSASREKKTRQDLSGSGWNDPKTAREAKQRQKEHSTNLLYGTIGVVFLVIAIAAVIWKSNIIPKTATAATVNGEKYTAAEVNFYFENYYQNFVNGNYSILSMIGLDTGTSLKDQTISSSAVMFVTDATEGETWYDYFADKALEQLAGVQAMNAAAEAEGFTWNDEMQADLDDTMESLASAASTYGYTEKQYLGLIYGSTMTRSIYEEQTRRSLLATAYLQSYQDSLTYSTDELEAAYQEDRTAYDLVDCAYVRVNGAAADTDEEGNSIEVTDEMKAEAMAAAKTTADAIYAAYKAGTSLEDAAAEYESTATYASSDSFSYSSSVLGEWLYDDARQAGDSAVLEDSDSSNYYVVVFNGRSRNEYNTVNVRHILIQPEASELSEDDEGYEDDVAAKDAEAAQKAQDILDEWKAGDATEDSFAALANEYSQDPGSNTTGGLYEQVYQGQMVTEFNDWCFDPARQTGDTGIIHNESTGYHVMYFVGYDQPYWEIQVSADLVNDAVDTFYEEKTEGYTAEQSSFGMSFVGCFQFTTQDVRILNLKAGRFPPVCNKEVRYGTSLSPQRDAVGPGGPGPACSGPRAAAGAGRRGQLRRRMLGPVRSRRADPGGQRHHCPHQPEPPAGGPPLHPGSAQGGGGGRPSAGHQSGCRAPSCPRSL